MLTISDSIQAIAMLVALASLIWQQRQSAVTGRLVEARIETKLRIFYAVADKDLTEEEIVAALGRGQPLSKVDQAEVRKSLYEMLSEETIRFTHERKFKPRQRSSRDGQA